jgi:hypothetical protein
MAGAEMARRRTSKRRTSRNAPLLRTGATYGGDAPFIVDFSDPSGKKRKSEDHWTLASATRRAKAAGRSDLPAVVWKCRGSGNYKPFFAVIEGRVLR